MRKGQFFIIGHVRQKERLHCKAFQPTQTSSPTKHALVFSDEKNFCQDKMVNSQNNSWLALFPQDVLILMKTKHPIHIMLFEVVTSNGNAMTPFVFLHGLRQRPTSSTWRI